MKSKFWMWFGGLALSCALLLGGCAPEEGPGAELVPKPVTGIDPLFSESIGINNESPSVFEEGGVRYVFFTREEKGKGKCIALSKAEKKGDAWAYGEIQTVLSPDETSDWDYASVYAPSVVKGNFKFKSETYSYLMAYAGSASVWTEKEASAQIGFAVAKTAEGPYVRIGKPVVAYDGLDWSYHGNQKRRGATEPSLVSYDKGSKVWLFYTFCAPDVAESARFLELDLTEDLRNVGSIPCYSGSAVTATGADEYDGQALVDSDWAYIRGEGNGRMIATGDSLPFEADPALSSSVGIYRADAQKALYDVRTQPDELVWEWVDSIDFTKTAVLSDEDRMAGYARIFCAGFVRDEYGSLLGTERAELIFTSSPAETEEYDYEYCRQLHAVSIVL